MDAAHGRAAPGGTFFGISMKDASKCLTLLALAHMIDQESNLSWADMMRYVKPTSQMRRCVDNALSITATVIFSGLCTPTSTFVSWRSHRRARRLCAKHFQFL